MGLSEKLNKHPKATAAGACVLIAVALVVVSLTVFGGRNDITQPTKAYYTTDEGKTLFADKAGLVPPFEHDGKEAVMAKVSNKSGTPTVTYLVRFTDAYKAALAGKPASPTMMADSPAAAGGATAGQPRSQAELVGKAGPPNLASLPPKFSELVKRPGDADWVPLSSAEGRKITALGPFNRNDEVFPK